MSENTESNQQEVNEIIPELRAYLTSTDPFRSTSATQQAIGADLSAMKTMLEMILDQRLSPLENGLKELQEKIENPYEEKDEYYAPAFSDESVDNIQTNDEFIEKINSCLKENQFLYEHYDNWALILTKKLYLVPPVESMSQFQSRDLNVVELKKETVFGAVILQYGEDMEIQTSIIKKLKDSGIKVMYVSKLSYIKRILNEI